MQLTQFKLPVTGEISVQGEYEGNEKSGKVVVFSHGFGMNRDARGMFVELGDLLKNEYLVVRFDYTLPIPGGGANFIYTYSTQKNMLQAVLNFVRQEFATSELNLITHSMGALIVSLAYPQDAHTIILNAPPLSTLHSQMREHFSKRDGTYLNEDGLSVLERSDGSYSILPKEYWHEMDEIKPRNLYKELAEASNLFFIKAASDEVVTDTDYSQIKKIPGLFYKELPGDHEFRGKDRRKWLATNVQVIRGEYEKLG